ncbi:mechanosensitive ion channel domain-containing protein [Reichenbachiella sp. MALMAid0571]|uniref:mechanosensitive ion channel family protein n=1 Tax=Reichenbachiella sp. MALMAid0571 TaxID=3143939 RepID=UPI0032DF7435
MTLKEILSYTFVESEHFKISVYSVMISMLIVLATLVVLWVIKRVFQRLVDKNKLDKSASWSVFQIIKYFIWVLVCVLILESLGMQISILLASIAALLVGVGLGLQQLFNDLASGLILLIERTLKIDDVIQLEDGEIGKVTHIGLRTSEIKTRDDIFMIVPNSKFVNDKIINWSHNDEHTRFHVNVGVAYGSDPNMVRDILTKCVHSHGEVSKKPEPFIRFNDFGESSLDFQIFFWVEHSFTVERIKSDLRYMIFEEFNKNGIEIPFPQRDLHIIEKKKII